MTSKSKTYRLSCRQRWLRRMCLAWILGLLLATWPSLHDVLADAGPATLSSPPAVAAEVPHHGHVPAPAGGAHCAAHVSCSPSALMPEAVRLIAGDGPATLPLRAATRTGITTAPPSPPPIARS